MNPQDNPNNPQNINYNYLNNPGQPAVEDPRARVMTLKDWIITMVLYMIPCVNIGFLIYWAVNSNENYNRQNWAKAMLIVTVGIYILTFVLTFVFYGALAAIFASTGYFPY